jgi:thioredoxin-related protein
MYRILILALIFSFPSAFGQNKEEEKSLVKWLTWKEAFELNKTQQKPFIVDVYTEWCGWCKHMMKTTYSNPDLATYINTYFYPVKFDAETSDTIEYLGTKYVNPEPGKKRSVHQLAVKLLGPNQSYPSTIFMGNNLQFTLLSSGYLEVKKIEPLLVYMVENIFRTTGYNDFETYYKKAFPDNPADTTGRMQVKRYSLQQALTMCETKPKKILVDIYTNWCNGCKVMNATSFSDSSVAKYINDNYYLVLFNAESKEPITYKGVTYNGGTGNNPFHDIIPVFTKGNFALPSLVILDEKQDVIDLLPFYLSPLTLNPVLNFYGSNSYKTQKWPDFQKEFEKKKKS